MQYVLKQKGVILINNTICFKKISKCIINLFKYFFTFFICLIFILSLQDNININDDIGFSFALLLSTFCFFILLKIEGKSPVKFLKFHKVNFKCIPLIIILAISIVLFSDLGVYPFLSHILNTTVSGDTELYWGSILHLVFLAPIFEEIFFRGIIFTKLKESIPLLPAIIIQAFIFGIFHGSLIKVLITMISGIIFAIMYNYTNNLTTVILLHSFTNLFLVILNLLPLNLNINPIIYIIISLIGLSLCIKLLYKINIGMQ